MIKIYEGGWSDEGLSPRESHSLGHSVGRKLLMRGLRELYGIPAGREISRTVGTAGAVGTALDRAYQEAADAADEERIREMLKRDARGKPYLKDYPGIHFNISHCRGTAVCAFADGPVGIDIECVRHISDELIRRVMTDAEQEMLRRYRLSARGPEGGSQKYDELCTRLWTLRESRVKYDGSGIAGMLDRKALRYGFRIDPDDISAPVVYAEAGLHFRQFRTARGCIAALCSSEILDCIDTEVVCRE